MRRIRWSEKKANKLLTLSEDRSFAAGFDEAVKRAHSTGLDYKVILGEDFEDPVIREPEPDVPLEVSSGPETDLSE